MVWHKTNRADPAAARIADGHYSRKKPGTRQFTPPGRVLCLRSESYRSIWATGWPYEEYVNRVFADAWINTIFRKCENHIKASEMIRQAVSATIWYFGDPPESGMITLIDRDKVTPIKRRNKLFWGYTYLQAGFEIPAEPSCQYTKERGLMILQLKPENMPTAQQPYSSQLNLLNMKWVK